MTTATAQRPSAPEQAAAAAAPLLVLRDVVVAYGAVLGVDHVSLAVGRGQLCGLIGPNGSGKSSLLAAVSRVGKLSGGSLEFDGQDYSAWSAHRVARLGFARSFQTVRLQEDLTVLENVMVGADKTRLSGATVATWLSSLASRGDEAKSRAAALEALDQVGLADMRDRFPTTLSYGTQRRVEIARCLASKPRLLLLDEPTAGMSSAETDEIAALLMRLRAEGLTQILVAHDLSMIHSVTDHVFALNFGKLVAQGRSTDVANDPVVRAAYIGVVETVEEDSDG
ncbi:MAG: ABC transporter ATP-binding protein [Rhizobiaceae bacterium]|nr:ABC transporter ATP-binding protein [Rhizobiaceae bacterium]